MLFILDKWTDYIAGLDALFYVGIVIDLMKIICNVMWGVWWNLWWNFRIWSFKLMRMMIYILVFIFYDAWVSGSGEIVIRRAAISGIYNATVVDSCFQVPYRYSRVFILATNIWKLWEMYSCGLFWISFAWKLIYMLASLERGLHPWCSLILSIIDNHYHDNYVLKLPYLLMELREEFLGGVGVFIAVERVGETP